MNGRIRFQWKKLLLGMLGSGIMMGLAVAMIHTYLNVEFKDHYSRATLVTERDMRFPNERDIANNDVVMLEQSEPNPDPIQDGETRIDRIQRRGWIRIGFDADRMPFCYFRADRKVLIGFDVQMAYYLADDLQVGIEFVPLDRKSLHQQLQDDHFDVAMSALEGTVKQATLIPSMDSYMEVTLAVVVPDHEQGNFISAEAMKEIPDLKLAVIQESYFSERARHVLPGHVEIIEIGSAKDYFDAIHEQVSGLVISAESGSAWTLRRPQFTVANPAEGRVRVPLYYMTSNDLEFESFLQNWLTLKRSNGTYDDLYDYWILGLEGDEKQSRWCIVRDVLGWVK